MNETNHCCGRPPAECEANPLEACPGTFLKWVHEAGAHHRNRAPAESAATEVPKEAFDAVYDAAMRALDAAHEHVPLKGAAADALENLMATLTTQASWRKP